MKNICGKQLDGGGPDAVLHWSDKPYNGDINGNPTGRTARFGTACPGSRLPNSIKGLPALLPPFVAQVGKTPGFDFVVLRAELALSAAGTLGGTRSIS